MLEVADVVPEWLDHVREAAATRGVGNLVATQADATSLPYESGTFDAAYMSQVLGETSDQEAALGELRRVLKPEGRLIIGESVPDPDVVRLGPLRKRAGTAGLRFDRKVGSGLAYFARFRPESAS